METIRGKASRELNFGELKHCLADYEHVLVDLGTGDGRYVCTLAAQQPRCFAIGVDVCPENLRRCSHLAMTNTLFVIAEAQHLPQELNGLASHLTINFPWGSLLESLLRADARLMTALELVSGPHASIDIRLNAGALAEAGTTLQMGAELVQDNLLRSGWNVSLPRLTEKASLRAFPSTWARRLAYGREPLAMEINGSLTR